jgi:hypothetical protein
MARTFQDDNFLIWEAFASSGAFGYPDAPHVVFNCLSNRTIRPRYVQLEGQEPEAQRRVQTVSEDELAGLFRSARPLE